MAMLENCPTIFEASYQNDSLREGEPPRRLACDRCRRQKLRCSRERIDSESCNRCLRANLECTDRQPLPMGRPNKRWVPDESRQKTSNRSKRQRSRSIETNMPSTVTEIDDKLRKQDGTELRSDNREPLVADMGQSMEDGSIFSPSAWPSLLNSPFPSPGRTTPLISPVSDNCTSPANLVNFPNESDIPRNLAFPDGFDFNNLLPPDDVINLDLSLSWSYVSGPKSPITSPNSSHCSLPTCAPMTKSHIGHMDDSIHLDSEWITSQTLQNQQYPAPHSFQILPPPEKPDTREDCMQKLWMLNLTMCKQLEQIDSGFQKDTTSFDTSDTSATRSDNTCSVGDILSSSESFMEMLRWFLPTSDSTSSELPTPLLSSNQHSSELPANSHEWCATIGADDTESISSQQNTFSAKATSIPNPQSDTPSILLILSCHIRLIRLYNNLFSRIHSSLLALPSLHLEPSPIVRDFQMGGFQLQGYGNLQILILLQVCTHLLNRIENTLGLPDEYMIGSREGSGGVLGKLASVKLIESVMMQEELESSGGVRGGIESLRKTMKEIRWLLKDR